MTVAPKGWSSELHMCEIEPLELGNTGILLLADDLEETCRELKKKRVEFTEEPTEKAGGTTAIFRDPDGNIFWLMPKSEYS